MRGVALVTGGQRGIGLGIAQALAAANFRVAMTSERPESDPEVKAALKSVPDATYHQHDMRNIDAISELLDGIERAHDTVTCLVSNAGIPAPSRGDLLDVSPASFDLVMNVNLKGGFFLAQAVAARMLNLKDQGYRSISFVTSISSESASIERAEYCISKAGAAMMTKLFATRLAEDGIGVFELRPGIVTTDMTASVKDKYDARIKDGLIPAKRWGTPTDVGNVIVPIASGHLAYSTGAVIPVDGGLHIPRL